MRNLIIIPLLYWFTSLSLLAQSNLHCGADEISLQLLQTHPELLGSWIKKYHQQENFIHEYELNIKRGGDTIFYIPVVVHVIHYDGTENISDAQIKNGIDVLNRNYRKQNPDTVDIVPYFKPIAADMGIEFRLAKLDPDGNCTNGINRIRSTLTNTGGHNVKDLIHWPRNQYLNIYVVKNAAGLAGHALMPFQADSIPFYDGIVIAGNYVGEIGTSNYVQSVVLSHEVGHYLNLYHIWGGNNVPGFYYLPCADTGNCAYDDGVFDTPNTIGWQVCNLSGNSCDTALDNVQNFMDYAYCARMFTEGQKLRARGALHSSVSERNNLWTATNLNSTGITGTLPFCKADFTTNKQIYCLSDTVKLYDASLHGATIFNWDLGDGSTSTLQNPTHLYSQPGIYSISFIASDGTNIDTVVKQHVIYVIPSASEFYLPYQEGFEALDSIEQTGLAGFSESNEQWTIMDGVGATGNNCIKIHCEEDTLRYKYSLISPVLNFSGVTDPRIDFKYAFAQKDSTNNDQMNVRVSKNCGVTWANLNTQTSTLPTIGGYVNGGYVPAPGDWRQMSINNLPGSYEVDGVIFRIDFISGGGNDLYIDDINVYDMASIGIEETGTSLVQIFPNPASDYFEMKGDFEKTDIRLLNMQGQLVMSKTIYSGERISIDELGNGVYVLEIREGSSMSFKKLIIQHN